jgi:hypothetical protein
MHLKNLGEGLIAMWEVVHQLHAILFVSNFYIEYSHRVDSTTVIDAMFSLHYVIVIKNIILTGH